MGLFKAQTFERAYLPEEFQSILLKVLHRFNYKMTIIFFQHMAGRIEIIRDLFLLKVLGHLWELII